MILSKILEQIKGLNRGYIAILISKNYIVIYNEFIGIYNITLFDFNGTLINSYRYEINSKDFNTILYYNTITRCIIPSELRFRVGSRWFYPPSQMLSGKETHVSTSHHLRDKVNIDMFEKLCEQNRISGPLMKYWEFDCKIIY